MWARAKMTAMHVYNCARHAFFSKSSQCHPSSTPWRRAHAQSEAKGVLLHDLGDDNMRRRPAVGCLQDGIFDV